MDNPTLLAYDTAASIFAQEWHDQPAPKDLHALVRQYFIPGSCADIGCGSGREVAWLNANGFSAIGYDASRGLLTQASLRYHQLSFSYASLPSLEGISDNSFDNVLCETVIMHLPNSQIVESVRRLSSILKPDGILYLSWRVTVDTDLRDKHNRLYSAFDATIVTDALNSAKHLLEEEVISVSSGKKIHRVIVRKS
jgi:2-polyprenyl-3-methyl-5-hydroxy-6-metoxy-1,4-benzoquinol methylase